MLELQSNIRQEARLQDRSARVYIFYLQENDAQAQLPAKRTGPARRTRRAMLLETVAEEEAEPDVQAVEEPAAESSKRSCSKQARVWHPDRSLLPVSEGDDTRPREPN